MSLSRPRLWLLSCVLMLGSAGAVMAKDDGPPKWTPNLWAEEDTLQFRTDCPDEGEHWSYVWLVVLDGEAYVRLGSRAAERVDCNKTKPMVAVRIADDLEFSEVEMVLAPDKQEEVSAAMADKYWTDITVRYMTHPYTMRLVPKVGAEAEKIGGTGK